MVNEYWYRNWGENEYESMLFVMQSLRWANSFRSNAQMHTGLPQSVLDQPRAMLVYVVFLLPKIYGEMCREKREGKDFG